MQLGNGAEYDTSTLIDEPNIAALATRAGDKIPSEWHDTIGAWASLRTHMRRVPPQSYESTLSMRLRHNADITAGLLEGSPFMVPHGTLSWRTDVAPWATPGTAH